MEISFIVVRTSANGAKVRVELQESADGKARGRNRLSIDIEPAEAKDYLVGAKVTLTEK